MTSEWGDFEPDAIEKANLDKKRTLTQNRAMHKYFTLLSAELNAAGHDMRKTLKPAISIDWTPESIKTYLWKPIQEAMFQKESTTGLDTKQVGQIYEVLNRHLGEKLTIHVPFPSNEIEMIKNYEN